MNVGKAIHPAIAQLKADLRKHFPNIGNPTEKAINSPLELWEWQKADAALWHAVIALDKRFELIEQALLELASKSSRGDFVAMKDWNKSDLSHSRFDPE